MKRKRIVKMISLALLVSFAIVGCGNKTDGGAGVTDEGNNKVEAPAPDGNGMPPIDGFVPPTPIDTNKYNKKWLDVPYADKSESQKLDIFLPEGGEGPFPVILYVHGGAFKIGDKREGDVIMAALKGLERGYAVVTINYRLSGEEIFPAAIEDVKAAIRFVRANADEYKIDGNKIALWGESAGGNLVSLAGLTGNTTDFNNDSLGNATVSSEVQVVIDQYGPLNFLKMDEQFAELGIEPKFGPTAVETSPESQYIGKLITEDPETVAKADPNNYITKDSPIFLIQHGTADNHVPLTQSKLFAENLAKVIGDEKVTFDTIEGAGHGDLGSDQKLFYTEENINRVLDFLDGNLK